MESILARFHIRFFASLTKFILEIDNKVKIHYYQHMERVPHIQYAPETGSTKGGDYIKVINTEQYRQLELFLKSKEEAGYILVTDENGKAQKEEAGKGYYRWIRIPLKQRTEYHIKIENAEVSIAYLSGNEHVMEEGICFLTFNSEAGIMEKVELDKFYNTPYREQYHFNPFKNWVNDPNGLCWYKGYYHLYFQSNPHKQEWNDMYWGHAASKDLIHWKHLPFVLEPQKKLLGNDLIKGGAFSGSAVVKNEEVLFYLTRHEGPQEDGIETREWQTMTRSKDMLTFEEEKIIIREKPEGVGQDFRDPKVSYINGQWYMVLACNYKGDSAMLLYKSNDLEKWEYVKPIVIEPEKGSTTFECPDFFTLGDKQVAVAALMRHFDNQGRYQMTRYYIGRLQGEEFEIEQTGWYDFGSNYYAVQSFEHEGRRIAIGWVSDFYGEHKEVENGAYGSFAIPRQLRIENEKLYMEPVPEIYSLKSEVLYEGVDNCVYIENILGNSYYVKVQFEDSCDFEIRLAEEEGKNISLLRKDGITMLKTAGVKTENIDFAADVNEVRELEIFVDRRLVEVFINKGEAAGAKVFYKDKAVGTLSAEFTETDAVKYMEVCTMKSIW